MFSSATRLDPDVRRAYLARLDVEAEPPSPGHLRLLVQRHAERVPYETLWIAAGEAWTIEPHESARRIAVEGRGGYCYHLNGSLGLLLTSLGYAVRGHVGGVHGPDGPTAESMGNHLVLTVEQQPSDANPGGVWYVDNGLGDALHDPLPLIAGEHDQAPFRLSLERVDEGWNWHLTHDPSGGFTGMRWRPDDGHWSDFQAQHQWLSTSPESGFVQVAMAERRDATGVDVIRGLVLSRVGVGARTEAPLAGRAEYFEVLAEMFDLRFDATHPDALDRLWARVLDGHRRWEQSQAAANGTESSAAPTS